MGGNLDLTVAAIVEDDKRFLFVEELVSGQPVINQPAGHVEPGESVFDAVIREALEETAWHFSPEAVTGIYLWTHPDKLQTFLRVAFCGYCRDHEPDRALDDGILRTLWLSRDELEHRAGRLRSPMVTRCIDDYLGGARNAVPTIRSLPIQALIERAVIL